LQYKNDFKNKVALIIAALLLWAAAPYRARDLRLKDNAIICKN